MNRLVLILLLILQQSVTAQTVNTISLGGDGVDGNFRSVGFTVKLDLKKSFTKYDIAVNSAYRWSKQSKYGTSDLLQFEDEPYLSANLAKKIGKLKFIGFTENQRSYLRSIDLRSSLGLGLGYSIGKDSLYDISISEIVLPEYYWSSDNRVYNNSTVRASTRLRVDINKWRVKISSTTMFQPAVFSTRAVSFANNLTVRSTNSFDFQVSKKAAIGLLYALTYDGYPYYINKAIKPLQQTASIMLKYKF